MNTRLRTLMLGCFLAISTQVIAEKGSFESVDSSQFELTKVASGMSVPWGMTLMNDNQLLVARRKGRLRLVDLTSGKSKKVSGLPKIWVDGQGGLMDIKLGPKSDNEEQAWLYITYSKPVGDDKAATTLARAKLKENKLTEWQDLLVTKSASDNTRHFGSRITFDDEGHLFFSVGDRGNRENGQDLSTHAGTIIRLNLDGSVPKNNPFVSDKNALDEIWTYGHRNPQGLFFSQLDNKFWSIEHGPRGGDEINLIEKGKNYGWPVISYGKEYWKSVAVGEGTHQKGMEQPVKYYVPSIAPSSLIVYEGDAFPQWKGSLLAGALKLTHLNRVVLDKSGKAIREERLFEDLGERIRNVIADKNGLIYFATDSGNVYRVSPKKS